MRRVVLFVAVLLLAVCVVILLFDAYNAIESSSFMLTDIGTLWNVLHSNSLQLLQPAIERHLHPYLWHPVLTSVLLAPAFLVFAVFGLLLFGLAMLNSRHPKKGLFKK